MRTDKYFFKPIAISALLVISTAMAGVAQNTTAIVTPEADAPYILSTSPTGGEMNVNINGSIEITFSNEMDRLTINSTNLILQATYADTMNDMHKEMWDGQINDSLPNNESKHSMLYTTGVVSGTISYSDKVAIFAPDNELKEGTLYTFTVSNDVKNVEKIALKNDHSWSFTTSDISETSNYDNRKSRSGGEKTETDYKTAEPLQEDSLKMIDLGKAGMYVILAKDSIHNKSGSKITGLTAEGSSSDSTNNDNDSKYSALRGDPTVPQSGQRDTASADVSEAIQDMMTAYSDASMQNGDTLSTHQDEQFHTTVFAPGVYEWSDSLNIEASVTFSGGSDDFWLFKTDGDLTVNENTVFTLTNGAQAENIVWYVEGNVTIGRDAQFEGIIMSANEITLEKGARLNGRMFSQTSITLDNNTITEPGHLASPTSSTNR